MSRVARGVLRLMASAAAGAAVALATGQVALLFTSSCSLLCDPSVAVPFGAVTGVFAFYPTGRS